MASTRHSRTLHCSEPSLTRVLLTPCFPRIEHLSPATLEALSSLAAKEPEQVQRLEALLAGDVSRMLSLPPAKRAKIEDTPQAAASSATTAATPQAAGLGEEHVPLLVLKDAVGALRMPRMSSFVHQHIYILLSPLFSQPLAPCMTLHFPSSS